MRSLCVPALAALLTCCGGSSPTPPMPKPPVQLPAIEHDFGVIPHGQSSSHDFVLDTKLLGGPCVPLRVHLDCSCGRGQLVLRHSNGTERLLDGSPLPGNAPTADETLIARVLIDTLTKDPIDLKKTVSHGFVVLQPTNDRDGTGRRNWPLLLRFGIECPVLLQPFAALDFGSVPASAEPAILTTLSGDEHHLGVKFGAAESSHPAITVTLEPQGDKVLVRTRCKPGEPGNHGAIIRIGTDLPSGYKVHLDVKWKAVPDLVATPTAKLSFRADLGREQRPEEATSQYLLVTDHDVRRKPEFTVHEIVSDDGRDATSSFAITLQPVPSQSRQHRLFVRYLGGQQNGFRGRLVLTKDGAAGPFLPIELVVFAAKT